MHSHLEILCHMACGTKKLNAAIYIHIVNSRNSIHTTFDFKCHDMKIFHNFTEVTHCNRKPCCALVSKSQDQSDYSQEFKTRLGQDLFWIKISFNHLAAEVLRPTDI